MWAWLLLVCVVGVMTSLAPGNAHEQSALDGLNPGANHEIYATFNPGASYDLSSMTVPAPAATFVVTNTNNGGAGSLRQAIIDSNNDTSLGTHAISFSIPASGVQIIALMTALPPIDRSLTIDGYTQKPCGPNGDPCSKPNTLAVGSDAVLLIRLDGENAGPANGLNISVGGGGSTFTGLVINRFSGSGIQLDSSGNKIAGCFIGTDPGGTSASPNIGSAVTIRTATNRIGGSEAADRNVLSGNGGDGVDITGINATGNRVLGNLIGTNKDGTAALANTGVGVKIEAKASNNTVGGTAGTTPGGPCTGECNVISGNREGVSMRGAGTGNSIEGNFIGTNATGTAAVSNTGFGIVISGSSNEVVGGTLAAARNLISGNLATGIEITNTVDDAANLVTVQGNFVGTTATGTAAVGNRAEGIDITGGTNCVIGGTAAGAGNLIAFNSLHGINVANANSTGNAIRGNSIHDNALNLGIDLGNNGVTVNDSLGHTGPNNYQNFPVITSATASVGAGNIIGTLKSTPGQTFGIDFYGNTSCDPSTFGEGEIYLGSFNTGVTDSNGNVSFTFVSPPLSVGQFVTATATDNAGNTSEFSSCVTVTPGCITSQPTAQTLCAGATASFSVSVSGANPTFQWRKDGSNIQGATSPTLTINNISLADHGSYDVQVSDTCSPLETSSSAFLTVDEAPSVTTQPTNQTVCAGGTASFSVSASGANLTFQWRKGGQPLLDDGVKILGATSPTLTINNTSAADAVTYDVLVSGTCGSPVRSNPAFLTVNEAPSVTTQPTDQTVCVGATASFSVSGSGANLTFQWRKGGRPLSDDGVKISGAASPTLTINNTSAADADNYDVLVSGSCGSPVLSNPASLKVVPPIVVTSCPASPITVPGNSIGRVVIPDLTSQVAATSNCGLRLSVSQLPVPETQVGPEPITVTITVKDSATHTLTCDSIINEDRDSDGIENSIDRNRTSQENEGEIPSNEFVTRAFVSPAEGLTSGTIMDRTGWTVHVIPSSVAGGVQASISGGAFGRNAFASISAFNSPASRIGLNTAGQIADITRNYPAPRCTQVFGGPSCLRTRVQAILTPLFHPVVVAIPLPTNRLTIDPRTDLFFRIALQQGQTVYVGSPITADPANQSNIEIEILHNSGSALGSLQLPPGQTVDIDQGASRELVVTNLDRAPLTLTFNDIGYRLSPGQALRRSLGPRAIYQEVLSDVTALREKVADKPDREKLTKAIAHLIAALDPKLSTDPFHLQPRGGQRVFDETKDAVNLLLDLIKNKQSSLPDTTSQAFIKALVNANRQLADIAINEAAAARGAQRRINEANEELKRGDRDLATHLPAKLKSAIHHYREAWKHAMDAAGR